MSQPTRSSVRTFSRTHRTAASPVVAEAIEGRQMFAAGPHPHGFGPPPGHWDARAEMTMVLPLTAVALFRAAAAEAAYSEAMATSATTSPTASTTSDQTAAAKVAQRAEQSGDRAVPVAVNVNAAKSAEVAVRHADVIDALQTTAAPADTADAATADASTSLTFGPFNVTAAMAATPTVEPKLTWVASTESSVLRPDVTPAVVARREATSAKVDASVRTDLVAADPIETQQAAFGLPTEAGTDRPLWHRVSAAIVGATLVAVNYVVRRRRRQLAVAKGVR